jgi:hypothetical protein
MLTTTPARSRRRAGRAVLAVAAATCALPGAAQAATIGITADGTLAYRGSDREINVLSVRDLADAIEVTDTAGLKPTQPFGSFAQLCVPVSSRTVRCQERPVSIKRIGASLNDQSDTASSIHTGLPVIIDGGSGLDTYVGGNSPFLSKVEFRGGADIDTVKYDAAGVGVRVSNDGAANDGRPGLDADNVGMDVENLVGSAFNDEITGVGAAALRCCVQSIAGGGATTSCAPAAAP